MLFLFSLTIILLITNPTHFHFHSHSPSFFTLSIMDSPQPNNRLSLTSSSAAASSFSESPSLQEESPVLNFLRNLSPINKPSTRYLQRFSQYNNFHDQPVFTSPRFRSLLTPIKSDSDDTDAATAAGYREQGDTHSLNSDLFQKEDHSGSSSGCIDEYLNDPADLDPNANASFIPLQSANSVEMESDIFLHPFSRHQQFHQLPPPDGDGLGSNKVGGSYRAFPQPLQVVGGPKGSIQSFRSAQIGYVKEADQQHQRGIRRHLQFGVTMGSKDGGGGETKDAAGASFFGNLVSHHPAPRSSSWQAGTHIDTETLLPCCPSQSLRSTHQKYGNDMSSCIPPGLGLPFTGIYRSMSMGSDSTTSSQKLEKQVSDISCSSARDLDDDQQESHAAKAVVPNEGRALVSPKTDMVVELDQLSPKRNRKKAKIINDTEGCKHCSCKKSKCLKLYCECFAAGVYCLDSCACEDCFNKPDYEDTVLDTRQQIENRNPLAFAPKVVTQATYSPASMMDEGNWTTPSSARHKRGCNCKKSKCLKKYCECYQAGVGCSSGCRCEGCDNTYGKKAESMYMRVEKWDNPSHEKLDTFETRDDFFKAGRVHQFTSKAEKFADVTPISQSLAASVSQAQAQAQAHDRISMVASLGHPIAHLSPKLLYGSRVMVNELSPDSFLNDMLRDDDAPEIFNNTSSTPTKTLKAGSPKQKRVSSPCQIRPQELGSSSSKELKSAHKFNVPDMPSFPPLTPYSKDEAQQIDGD